MIPYYIGISIIALTYFLLSPLQHLLVVLGLGVGAWLKWPKDTLWTSYMSCAALALFGHVDYFTAVATLISHPVALLVVGCLLAQIIVKNNIHLVLSERLMTYFKPRSEFGVVQLMLGISAFLSMWMSNTSVVAMLIPVVVRLSESLKVPVSRLLISIAYGATIGGMLTPIGTPANLVAIAYADRYFGIEIDFALWFSYALPFVALLMLSLSGYFYYYCSKDPLEYESKPIVVSYVQKQLMVLLGICTLLWATQACPFGGWKQLLSFSIKEEWIGLVVILLCSQLVYQNKKAFELADIQKLPFASIWMVIAGIFMAEGMIHHKVISLITDYLATGTWLYDYQTMALFGFLMSMVTEVCSNTAVTSLGLPLSDLMMHLSHLKALPCIFLLTFSANSAFMLPSATPPNALVLGTGKLSSSQLVTAGLIISLSSLFILMVLL